MRREFSAGGVTIRKLGGRWMVAAIRPGGKKPGIWALPKGAVDPGEDPATTAVREVAEETGLEVRITGPLQDIEYWFVQSGARIHKTVHYFMMEPVGGDLERHDHEFDQVRWIDFGEAAAILTFETERALVAHAADRLRDDATGVGGTTAGAGAAEAAS